MQNKLEKPKFKHNKKRNTAFLFEALVKELTKAAMYDNKEKQRIISSILKEHFKKGTLLDRELSLYKQIYETKEFPKDIAEKLISKVKEEHQKINEAELYTEQSKLIGKINKIIGMQVYDNFVPQYKTLASLSQIFNSSVQIKQKILLEQELLETITSKKEQKKVVLESIDSLAYKRFIERFNETYSKSLLEEQKNLLNKFVNHSEEDIELKLYVSEEVERLKNTLSGISIEEEQIKNKLNNVKESLNNLKINIIDENLIKKIMLIQEFTNEVKQ